MRTKTHFENSLYLSSLLSDLFYVRRRFSSQKHHLVINYDNEKKYKLKRAGTSDIRREYKYYMDGRFRLFSFNYVSLSVFDWSLKEKIIGKHE